MPIKNLPFGDFTREDCGPEIVGPAHSEDFVSLSLSLSRGGGGEGGGDAWENPGPMDSPFAVAAVRTTIVSKLEIPSSLIPPKIPRRDAPGRKLRGEVYFRACRPYRGRDGRMFRTRGTYTGRKCVRIHPAWRILARYG